MLKSLFISTLKGFFPYLFRFKNHTNHKLKNSDIKQYYLNNFPSYLQNYLSLIRFDRPVGTLLALIPALWSLSFYGKEQAFLTQVYHYILVILGAFIARSIGCIINDIIDIKIDQKVERTKNRPLALGTVKVWQAILLCFALALVGFFILTLFNTLTILVIGSSVVLIAVYPLMKRLIKLPQAFLALVFNWGVFIGPCIYGNFDFKIIFLYISAMLITFAYDSSYAVQDMEDDKTLSINSSALYFGDKIKNVVLLSYTLAIMFFMLFLSLNGSLNVFSYIILALAFLHILWQIFHISLKETQKNLVVFNSNVFLLLLLYFASFA